MAVHVRLKDNSRVVVQKMEGNVSAALEAIGIKAVNLILRQMQSGYGKPIRDTGDLMRDVQYEVEEKQKQVKVGNTLYYGPYVHEGTRKMKGRPYIQDSLTDSNAANQLRKVAEQSLKKGF